MTASLITPGAATCAGLNLRTAGSGCSSRRWSSALVVGAGAIVVRVVELLGNHPGGSSTAVSPGSAPLPLLGEPAELADVVARGGGGLRAVPGDHTEIGCCRPGTPPGTVTPVTFLRVLL
ncbi:MAG: hypothetical protein ACRDTH_19580, partial [Pseudonocardiaceae bacterium]